MDDYVAPTDWELEQGRVRSGHIVRQMFSITDDGIEGSDAAARWPEPLWHHDLERMS